MICYNANQFYHCIRMCAIEDSTDANSRLPLAAGNWAGSLVQGAALRVQRSSMCAWYPTLKKGLCGNRGTYHELS